MQGFVIKSPEVNNYFIILNANCLYIVHTSVANQATLDYIYYQTIQDIMYEVKIQ